VSLLNLKRKKATFLLVMEFGSEVTEVLSQKEVLEVIKKFNKVGFDGLSLEDLAITVYAD
jgi:hypothetical protein